MHHPTHHSDETPGFMPTHQSGRHTSLFAREAIRQALIDKALQRERARMWHEEESSRLEKLRGAQKRLKRRQEQAWRRAKELYATRPW
jgi:hypothetical protein